MIDVFCWERELCKLFKSNDKNLTITFYIAAYDVQICVRHFGDSDSQKGEVILNKLWKILNFPLIGWNNKCKVMNCKGFLTDDIVSEYVYTMKKFDFSKMQCAEFLDYNNKYISIMTEQN